FCHDFSAMSQCSRQPEEMQAGSHRHRKEHETMQERSCGYFALHVSVAHVAPSTTKPTETSTEMATLPSTVPSTFTYTSKKVTHRKRGAQSFEKTHERITLWIDKGLKQRFEDLAEEQGKAKSTLLDEAIAAYLEA